MKGQDATKKDAEGKVHEVRVQPPKEVQLSKMEIDMITLGATDARRKVTILDKTTLLDRGICILDVDRFMWI